MYTSNVQKSGERCKNREGYRREQFVKIANIPFHPPAIDCSSSLSLKDNPPSIIYLNPMTSHCPRNHRNFLTFFQTVNGLTN